MEHRVDPERNDRQPGDPRITKLLVLLFCAGVFAAALLVAWVENA